MNNDKLEPGDMAIITKSVDGLSVGRIVTCIQVDGVHSKYGTIWLVEGSSPFVTEYGAVGYRAHQPQDWMKKIPKDPLPDEEDEKSLDKELEQV